MDATGERFAYRCTPLTIANSTGWELVCPCPVRATWNGGTAPYDLVIEHEGLTGDLPPFAESLFGHGVLTFHSGYLFRTDPEWAIWCRGSPNSPKEGIVALDGLVETDWLPFHFTMDWLFTRPGAVRFEKGEPFCFILPIPHITIEAIKPKIVKLSENPELEAEHAAWAASREDFNRRLAERDPAATKEKWQGFYSTGKSPRGALAPDTHRIERKMAEPEGARPRSEDSGETRPGPAPAPASQPVAQHIIWVASYPKSGNTWVRIFLHNLLKELSGAGSAQDINRLHEHSGWEIFAAPFEQVLGKPIARATRVEIAGARSEVQRRLANARAAPILVKTHLCVGEDYGYPTINLNATLAAVYVVRNPLDIAVSYSHHSGQSIDVTIAHMATRGLKTLGKERDVFEVLGTWSQHIASWMGMTARPVHLLRYEDMLASPERVFMALARFLRLAPSADQLKRAIAKSSFAELSRQEKERGFKERSPAAKQFFREGRTGQWRDVLTPKQVQDICAAHAPMMQRFGYLPPDCGLSIPVVRPEQAPARRTEDRVKEPLP
jgi:hypothetical protein